MPQKIVTAAAVALLPIIAAAILLTPSNGSENSAAGKKRLSASEVKLSNLAGFEAQLRRDIPLGTSKQAVEVYLAHEKIPHGFADVSYGVGGNEFYGTLKNIGVRWGFPAHLAVRIHLDQREKVDNVSFRVDYDAP